MIDYKNYAEVQLTALKEVLEYITNAWYTRDIADRAWDEQKKVLREIDQREKK